MSAKRNGKIEFLRFFFSLIIMLHHSRAFLGDEISPFLGGSLAVEFFFFVSGYLMMASVERKNSIEQPESIGKETVHYLSKKWLSVIPESLISYAIAFAIIVTAKVLSASDIAARLIDSIWEPFFLSMTGLGKKGINTPVWYISAMLLSMAVLYPLLRKHHDITIHLIIPLASLLILGYLYQNYGQPRGPSRWLGWTHKGTLRAFAEIGIGCLLFYLSSAIRRIHFKCLGKWLITLTENAIYIVIICYMYLAGASKYDYFFIAILAVAVALTFSEAGIHNKIFDTRLIQKLAGFSVPPVFLTHGLGK